MYKAKAQKADEHKSVPVQTNDGGSNANKITALWDDLVVMGNWQNSPQLSALLDRLAMMENGNSEEWSLLQYLAWLDSKSLSEELLLAITRNERSQLQKTIGKLAQLNLVKIVNKGDVAGFTISSLVQFSTRSCAMHNISVSKNSTQLLLGMLKTLSDLLPAVTDKPDKSWEIAAVYAPTAEALLERSASRSVHIPESKELAVLYSKLGAFYRKVSIDVQKALDYKEKVLATYQAIYKGNHPDIANSLNSLGGCYADLGLVKKALPYLEQALTMKRALAGPPNEASSFLNNLGSAYVTLGEGWKGVAYLQQALIANEAVHKGNHPNLASALNNLGSAYATIGETTQGLYYQKQALEMYRSLYPVPHPDIAMALHNVGSAYEKLGGIHQGLVYKEQALEMRLAFYEGNHPEVARSFHSVGDTYKTLGNAVKALEHYEKGFAIRHSIYGENGPDVASSLNAIGMAYEALGHNDRCLEYQQRALKIWKAFSEGNHHGIATSLNNIGIVLRKLGNTKKNLEYRERALEMRQALYPDNHPDVANSLNNLGIAHEELGDFKKAFDYYEQAFKMRQALYPGNHRDVAASLNTMGAALQGLGEHSNALEYYKRALSMREAIYPDGHAETVGSLNTVCGTHRRLGNIKESLDYKWQALVMRQVLEGNKPDIENALHSLGRSYEELGDTRKSFDCFERSIKMRQALYPGSNADVAEPINAVGVAYDKLGDIRNSLEHKEPALEAREIVYKGDHAAAGSLSKSYQEDEHKGASVQVHDGVHNANQVETILHTLLIMGGANSEEWNLLQYLAWLDPGFISEELLLTITRNEQNVLQKTIRKLEKLGLVKAISKGDVAELTISSVVQDQVVSYAIHNPAVSKNPIELLLGMLELLGGFLPEVTDKLDSSWQKAEPYVLAVEALLERSVRSKLSTPENKNLVTLYYKLGVFYWKVSVDTKKSLDYKTRAIETYSVLHIDNTHVDTILPILMIGGSNSKEWMLLQHMAWLDPGFIPANLLEAVMGGNLELSSTFSRLGRLGFTKVIDKDGALVLTISREMQDQIVHYAMHNPTASKGPTQLLVDMVKSLSGLLPAVTDKPDESWERAAAYAPTAEALLERSASRSVHIPESKELAVLYSKLGAFYRKVSIDVQKALDYKEKALATYQAIYKGNHPDIANSLNSLGGSYATLGLIDKAMPYLENALTMKRSFYSGPHLDVASSLNNLGNAYVTIGEGWKGVAYLQEAFIMTRASYKEDHPNLARSLNNIGSAYATIGKIAQGLYYQTQALEMYKSLYEAPHPDIAMALHNVGSTHEKLGDIQQGITYKEEALKMRLAFYKGDHPEVARSFHFVGDTYKALGKAKEALELYKRGFTIRNSIYEENGPDVASSLNAIGMAHEALGDAKQCLEYQERALKIWQACSKGDNPGIATSLNNMGIAHKKLGNAKESLEYREQALAMRESLYPDGHPDVANSLNSVGVAYVVSGDIINGIGYYERALAMRESLYPDGHPDIANSLHNLGIAHQKLRELNKAIDYYKRSLSVRKAIYKGNHPDVVTSLNAMSIAYEKLGNIRKSLKYKEQALDMRQVLEGDDSDIAKALHSMGVAYEKLGDVEDIRKSIDYYEQALVMRQTVYKGNHPAVLESLNAVGSGYHKLGGGKRWLYYIERALAMRQALENEGGFKGQGTLGDDIDRSLEYYNSGIDQILGLRLVEIGYGRKAVVLQSRYFEGGFSAARLADDVGAILSGGYTKTVLAPVNLYNKHWLGLLFKMADTMVEVTYMDSEQRIAIPELKKKLKTSLALNGYESRFLEASLERQRYGNCGLEVIENFVYYLTGTRATQEAAVYVHSLLVENSLLNTEEYGLKIEENNKLIGFLSNSAPLSIRSIESSPSAKIQITHLSHVTEDYRLPPAANNRQLALNLLPAVKQFNECWEKWVMNKLHKANAVIYETTLEFKKLDLAVDSVRFVHDPGLDTAKKVAIDAAYLYSLVEGVNGYSTLVSGTEVVYQLHLGEYQKAFDVAAGSLSAMALPVILAHVNRPYLGFVYSLFVAASTAYNAMENAYSFALELAGRDDEFIHDQ
jgi:tetratricopeptide (TPR) repeat protein